MESEARYVRVGVATLLLIALLAGGLFWLAGRTGHQAQERYTIYFRVQSLEGLQINSDVRMQGIKVGKVIDYAIMPGEAHKVRVVIQVDARTPMLQGVKAIITRQIVTGLAAIDLDTPPDARKPLAKAPEGEPYPVIPEGVSQLAKMTDTMQSLSQSLQESMARFNTLLSDRNQQAVANTLNNLDRLTSEASKTLPEFQAAMTSIRRAADQVGDLSDTTRTTMDQAGRQLDRLAVQASDTLAVVNRSAAGMSTQISDLTGRVALTADLAGQQIDTTSQSLGQAGNALQDTGRTLSDPARALFGPSPYQLGPGEEIRK
jgi:phospholipid/cholesterol/gamma-HCH transport system substrate-binding protein